MGKVVQKLLSLLAGLAPWFIVAGLAYAAAFIKPETELRPLPQPLVEARDVFFDVAETATGSLIFVGNNGTYLVRDANNQWQRGQFPEQLNLQAVAVDANNMIAIVGNQGALYTFAARTSDNTVEAAQLADSRNWHYQKLPVSDFAGKLLAVTAAADGFWVVGEMGTIFQLQQQAEATELAVLPKKLTEDVNLNDVEVQADGSVWIAAEFGMVMTSTDQGETWSTREITDVTLQSLVFADNAIMVVGNNGYIARSDDDGNSWQQVDSSTDAHFYKVVHTEKGWFAAGAKGTLMVQAESAQWSALTEQNTSFGFVSGSAVADAAADGQAPTLYLTGSNLVSVALDSNDLISLELNAVTPTAKGDE